MEDTSEDQSWGVLELILTFVVAWIAAVLYHGFSDRLWLGENPFTGSTVLVILSCGIVAFNTSSTSARVIRVLAPLVFVYLFYSAANGESGFIPSLQERLEFPHFILVLVTAVLATFFTAPKPRPIEEPEKEAELKEKVSVSEANLSVFDRIVGQEHVIESLQEIARIAHSGIRVGKRNAPHAVLLFLGPTGVGKTEAATALAEAVYGTRDALIRFDMGQFNDASQANRFYGPPPGYIGSEEGGQLTRAVLKKPKSVVLLDEMEKAHTQIWDAFLPVFDEGYIVDGSNNQKVDMTNTIIVLTSNLLTGENDLRDIPAFELKERIAAKGSLRTELLGRINEILVFKPLSRTAIAEILRRRLDSALWSLSEQGIPLQVEEADIMRLVDDVQKAKFGVRQIDDVVRTYLRKAISQRPKEAQ